MQSCWTKLTQTQAFCLACLYFEKAGQLGHFKHFYPRFTMYVTVFPM